VTFYTPALCFIYSTKGLKMNKYKIMVGKYYKICEWTAESKDKAVSEFLEMNPSYKNHTITVWAI
jgi:hypothetical protein